MSDIRLFKPEVTPCPLGATGPTGPGTTLLQFRKKRWVCPRKAGSEWLSPAVSTPEAAWGTTRPARPSGRRPAVQPACSPPASGWGSWRRPVRPAQAPSWWTTAGTWYGGLWGAPARGLSSPGPGVLAPRPPVPPLRPLVPHWPTARAAPTRRGRRHTSLWLRTVFAGPRPPLAAPHGVTRHALLRQPRGRPRTRVPETGRPPSCSGRPRPPGRPCRAAASAGASQEVTAEDLPTRAQPRCVGGGRPPAVHSRPRRPHRQRRQRQPQGEPAPGATPSAFPLRAAPVPPPTLRVGPRQHPDRQGGRATRPPPQGKHRGHGPWRLCPAGRPPDAPGVDQARPARPDPNPQTRGSSSAQPLARASGWRLGGPQRPPATWPHGPGEPPGWTRRPDPAVRWRHLRGLPPSRSAEAGAASPPSPQSPAPHTPQLLRGQARAASVTATEGQRWQRAPEPHAAMLAGSGRGPGGSRSPDNAPRLRWGCPGARQPQHPAKGRSGDGPAPRPVREVLRTGPGLRMEGEFLPSPGQTDPGLTPPRPPAPGKRNKENAFATREGVSVVGLQEPSEHRSWELLAPQGQRQGQRQPPVWGASDSPWLGASVGL